MITRAAGRVPVSLLVVPRYHGATGWDQASRRWLLDAACDGDEIVLHGCEHRSPDGVDGAEFGRRMPPVAAVARLDMAVRGLAELGLRADGFIAPRLCPSPRADRGALRTTPGLVGDEDAPPR